MQVGDYRIDAKLGETGALWGALAFDTLLQIRVWLVVGDVRQLLAISDTLRESDDVTVLDLRGESPAYLAIAPGPNAAALVEPLDRWFSATPAAWLGETVAAQNDEATRVVQALGDGNVPQALASLSRGRYVCGDLLGQGGMGRVYRARDERLQRDVAIKVMLNADERDVRMRFHREARAMGRVRHPNIVEVIEYSGASSPLPFLVLELVDGATVSQVLQLSRFPSPESLCVVAQLADALAAVHAAGLVHRDVKPENVFVDANGRVVLGDFGIVRGLEQSDATGTFVRRQTAAIGSPLFASPEQVVDPNTVEGASDIFSLGSFLFALLTGKSPYASHKHGDTLLRLARAEPPLFPAQVDAFCQRLVLRMLSASPSQRPSAVAVAEACRGELNRRGILDPRAKVRSFLGTSSGMTGDLGGATRVVASATPTAVIATAATSTDVIAGALNAPKRSTHPAVYATAGFALAAVIFGALLLHLQAKAPHADQVAVAPLASAPAAPPALPQPDQPPEVPKPLPLEEKPTALAPVVVDRRPATVRFITKPFATVFADGRRLGETPIFNTTELPPGTHKVRFENPKFQPKELVIALKPGEARDVRVELERQ